VTQVAEKPSRDVSERIEELERRVAITEEAINRHDNALKVVGALLDAGGRVTRPLRRGAFPRR
jgi:hypothetical protein